jgi:hypothetical protein
VEEKMDNKVHTKNKENGRRRKFITRIGIIQFVYGPKISKKYLIAKIAKNKENKQNNFIKHNESK